MNVEVLIHMCDREVIIKLKNEVVPLIKNKRIFLKNCQLHSCKPENAMNDVFSVCMTDL